VAPDKLAWSRGRQFIGLQGVSERVHQPHIGDPVTGVEGPFDLAVLGRGGVGEC